MNKVIELPQPQRRQEEANLWVTRMDRGFTTEEVAGLREWLVADSRNVELFLETASLWSKMDSLARLSELFPQPVRKHPLQSARVLAVAASVVFAVLAGWLVMQARVQNGVPPAGDAQLVWQQVYETAVGEQLTISLPDGSQLVLNTDSRIDINYGVGNRLLSLERGEVHVRVAKDPKRPLSVLAAGKIVQAVGTEFNIEITDKELIELVVTEGRVRVGISGPALSGRDPEAAVVLPPDVLTVAANEGVILGDSEETVTELSADDIEVKLSWQRGNLIFRGEPLEDAMKEVSRYTAVEFVFLDEELKKVRVAGLFKADDVDGLLAVLRENFNITFERVDDHKVLLDNSNITP